MREPVEAEDLLVRSIQPTRSNSFNQEGENDLRMLPWFDFYLQLCTNTFSGCSQHIRGNFFVNLPDYLLYKKEPKKFQKLLDILNSSSCLTADRGQQN